MHRKGEDKVRINPEIEKATHCAQEFVVDDETELVYHIWEPISDQSARGLVVLMHGLGDHILHMMTVVEFMIKRMNLIVCGYDQRGHGNSPGPRGHIASWGLFRSDLTLFCEILTQKFPKLPIILFGNSMGGLCVLDYVMRAHHENVKGVIANAPALSMQDLKSAAGGLVWACSKVAPGLSISADLNSAKLTRDIDKQKENNHDMLVHSKASMKMLDEIKNAGKWVTLNPSKLQLPLLLLQGTNDPIVIPAVNIDFEKKVRKHNQQSFIFENEGGMHELFNDTDRELVFEQCRLFIELILELGAI